MNYVEFSFQDQFTEPLQRVHGRTGNRYPLMANPFRDARLGLAQAMSGHEKSVVVKAVWFSFISTQEGR